MKLNIICSIIVLWFSVTFLCAQTDSLSVVSDSLLFRQAKEDSLLVQALLDSLENEKPEIDYSAYMNLQEKVEKYKTENRLNFKGDSNKGLFWSLQGHLFGLSTDNYFIKKDNFSELSSLYPTYLKLQNYNRLYTESATKDFYNLTKEKYSLPVTTIDVVAGTGDYDLGAGYFALKKDKFLEKYNLDFRMNFVKGDFYYGSELASNSSTNLAIPFENSLLNIAFNSISYEGPYYRLSPAFRLSNTIFEETSQALSLYYVTNYLDVGLKYSTENYKRITPSAMNREYFQLLLTKNIAIQNWNGAIGYEYFIHNEDFYSQEFNSLSSDIDHLLSLDFSSDYERLNISNRLVLTHPYQLLSNTNLTYNLTQNWQLGAFTNFRETLKKENLFKDYTPNSDQVSETSIVESIFYHNEKNNTGLSLNYQLNRLNLTAELGNATIDAKIMNSPFNKTYQAVKTQFAGDYTYTYQKYSLNLSSIMKFYQELDGVDIHYLPRASLTNSAEITRDVNHNNYIKAGVAHHYFDSYLAFNSLEEVLYPETSLLDLYLGFQITKQFEINAYWKNILDNHYIAGQQTIPQSITVLISWNFLN